MWLLGWKCTIIPVLNNKVVSVANVLEMYALLKLENAVQNSFYIVCLCAYLCAYIYS